VPIWETLLQEWVPPSALSRVSAYDWMGSLVFAPLGLALAGPVASLIGLQATLVGSGIFGVIAVAAIVAVPDVRNIRRRPAE
jgi:MFS family permease